jgi:membrane protein DedA with SNARE-associated domain
MLTLAAITDSIVNAGTDFIGSAGLPAVFLLMVLESACLPVPSEGIMLFAGFSVEKGDLSFVPVVIAGVLGNLVGSWIAYGIGYYGRLEVLERNRFIHISPKHLAWADSWFERYGSATVFFTRMMPIIRTFISLPAGIARMPFWRFTIFTLLGCIPWIFGLTLIGKSVGANWEDWKNHLHYVDYVVIAAIVVGIGYLIVRWRRGGGDAGAAEPKSADAAP